MRSVAHAATSFAALAPSSFTVSRRRSSASSRSAGTVHLAAQRRPHREEVARRGDVVHAQHVRAVVEAVRDRGERAAQALARRPDA